MKKIGINSLSESYKRRYDLNEIKEQLAALVPDEEYWQVFRLFIHGKCKREEFDAVIEKYLDTPEKKHLHNKFIRAIIFNAHFSTVYPPGYVPENKIIIKNPAPALLFPQLPKRAQKFKTYSAADLRAIPSIVDFQKKLETKSREYDITVSRECGQYINYEVKKFVTYILEKSLMTIGKPPTTYRTLRIMPQCVKEAIRLDERIASVISADLYSRYSEFE